MQSSIEPKTSISQETKELVHNYYCRNDISRQAPGKKDYITTWKEGGKVRMQKRHLYYTVNETYSLFKQDNPDLKIGKSKFAELKPQHVLHRSDTPKDACLCLYHENVILICEALHKAIPEFPVYSSEFVSNFVCSPTSETCMLGHCEACKEKGDMWLETFEEGSSNQEVTWYEWARETNEVAPSKQKAGDDLTVRFKRMEKRCQVATAGEALASLSQKIPAFLTHVFIKREQSNHFQYKLCSIPPRSALVQVDFSENYNIQQQGEVQSAHWNQQQLSLFTICVWLHQSQRSIIYVSDHLEHDKTTVLVLMNKLFVELTKSNGVKKIDVFSDGPSSQFKNQYVFNALPYLVGYHCLDRLNWHFFATSHGKGAVDGIGGSVKRDVWMATVSRQHVVTNLEDFCRVARSKQHKVEAVAITSADIQASAKQMKLQEIFTHSTPVAGIKKKHFVSVEGSGIRCKDYSNQLDADEAFPLMSSSWLSNSANDSELNDWYDKECQKLAPQQVSEGDYVICKYEGELFPGIVTVAIPDVNGATVKAMQKCAGGWKWPEKDDKIDYLEKDIIQKIDFPVPVNNRGTYRVKELEKQWGH